MNRSIFEVCPDIVGVNLLYVGFNRHIPSQGIEYKKWWYDLFVSKGFSKFTILEIFSMNVEFAEKYFILDRDIDIDVVEGNVLSASKYFKDKEFDVSLWWHGPEHVYEEEIDLALKELELITSKFIIIGCPNGMQVQKAVYGNANEIHLSGPDEKFFKNRGFLTKVISRKGFGLKPHLTGVKILHE